MGKERKPKGKKPKKGKKGKKPKKGRKPKGKKPKKGGKGKKPKKGGKKPTKGVSFFLGRFPGLYTFRFPKMNFRFVISHRRITIGKKTIRLRPSTNKKFIGCWTFPYRRVTYYIRFTSKGIRILTIKGKKVVTGKTIRKVVKEKKPKKGKKPKGKKPKKERKPKGKKPKKGGKGKKPKKGGKGKKPKKGKKGKKPKK